MLKPPRDPAKDTISNKNWMSIVLYAAAITLLVILAVFYCKLSIGADSKSTNNVAFVTLAFAQLFHVFNMSAPDTGLLKNEITRNKFVWMAIFLCTGFIALVYMIPQTRLVLNLVALPFKVWVVSIFAALLPLILVQLYKAISKIRNKHFMNDGPLPDKNL